MGPWGVGGPPFRGAVNYYKLIIVFQFFLPRPVYLLVPIITRKVVFHKVHLLKFDMGALGKSGIGEGATDQKSLGIADLIALDLLCFL